MTSKQSNILLISSIVVLVILVMASPELLAASELFNKGSTKLTEAKVGVTTWFWGGATLAAIVTFIMFLFGKAQWKILGVIGVAIFGVASISELVTFISE